MAFSVENFKGGQMSDGWQRPHSFEVYLDGPGNRITSQRAESVSVPGLSWYSVDNYRPNGNGKTYSIPYAYNASPITMTFLVDEKDEVIQSFYDWGKMIVEMDGKFSAKYYRDYAGRGEIYFYNQKGGMEKTVTIEELYPTSVDQAQLSWADTDTLLRLTVSFAYTHYRVS